MPSAPSIRKKLIEVSIPLEAINIASKKQKAPKGYPTALHKYWAPRPIAACRGVLFAQLVDDPSSWPERFDNDENKIEAERKRLHKVIADMVPWEASNNEAILNTARWEIARSVAWGLGEEPPPKNDGQAILSYLQTKAPPVCDPFSGTGAISLEVQRLGLRAYGSDLNPVAVLIGKALVEIPPKFADRPPVNPKARAEAKNGELRSWKRADGLSQDVLYYGQWMRDEAEKRIGYLYPKAKLSDGSEATVIAWLWARTVRSPDPAAKGAMVPLVSSFLLSTKKGRNAWVEPIIDADEADGYRFQVKTGTLSNAEAARLKKGTKAGRATFSCLLSGAPIGGSYIDSEAEAGRMSSRLMAVVTEAKRGRAFVSPSSIHEDIAKQAALMIATTGSEMNLPTQACRGTFASNAQGRRYGFFTFSDYFSARQLIALSTFSDIISDVRKVILKDARTAGFTSDQTRLSDGGDGGVAYSDAIATYLSFVIDRAAEYGSTLSTWLPDDSAIRGTYGRQGLAMSWDYCEGNYFGDSSAALTTICKVIANVIAISTNRLPGFVGYLDAAKNNFPARPCFINTDPPYYDNVGYADLSDFFYVWLRRSLSDVWPDLFRRLTTPKNEELVAERYRYGSQEAADAHFINGMSKALNAMQAASDASGPLAIYYAFKQSETTTDGIASAGWASFLQAVVNAGFVIDGTWPLRTESGGRLVGNKANALASSIVLICRNQISDAPIGTRAEFVRALKHEMPDAIDDIRKAGVGPVDMQQSVIGPGMGVFTRYAKVLEDDDSAMTVKTALSQINRVWEEIENELDTNFDAETQVALAWFATYGFDARASGELITLANAKNIPSNALFNCGVFKDLKGKAALTPRNDWWPAEIGPTESDEERKRKRDLAEHGTATVWACVQKAAAILNAESGGGEAAGRFVAHMGTKAEAARALAYRLFEIATKKGWAAEALVYNELAQEWPKLEELASIAGVRTERATAQGTLQF
jgi:putative DNA methylase